MDRRMTHLDLLESAMIQLIKLFGDVRCSLSQRSEITPRTLKATLEMSQITLDLAYSAGAVHRYCVLNETEKYATSAAKVIMQRQRDDASALAGTAPLAVEAHEIFARFVATGDSGSAAYARTYARKEDLTCRVNACRLLARPDIAARVASLRSELASQARVTIASSLEALVIDMRQRISAGDHRKAESCLRRMVAILKRLESQSPA